MGRAAIVILDLQNGFITDRTKSLPKKIKRHIESQEYDFIVFSKFINSATSNFVKKLGWNKCKKSPSIDIVEEFSEITSKNNVFEKSTYSIFKSRDFVDFIGQNKISKLFFCGLDLDGCVLASAFEAFDLGFDFEILHDLMGSSASFNIYDSAKQIIARNL